MTESNPESNPKQKNTEGAPRKPFGPFLFMLMGLLLLLVYFGSDPPALSLSEDAFWFQLHTGQVEQVQEDAPNTFEGLLKSTTGGAPEAFIVNVPDTSAIHAEVRDLKGKQLLLREPMSVGTLTSKIQNKTLNPTQGYAITLREWVNPKEHAQGETSQQRFFLDYQDSDGAHYAEILSGSENGPNLIALESLLKTSGASSRILSFDGVNGIVTKKTSGLKIFFYSFAPFLLFLGLIWFMMGRQMKGQGQGLLSFGRSRAVTYNQENKTGVTFDDVAGIDEAKDEVTEIIQFLKSPEKFKRLGGRIPRGVLLVGSPGTGKTLLAKAIAGEADVPFVSISGSDFVEMFVGVGASRVRDLFEQARKSAPCIIFLDEIDAVGRKRGSGMGGGNEEREQTLNAILVEMDGFGTDANIIVVAATNRPDVLDAALLRPGRFDREIVIDLPDVKGREKILSVHSKHVKLAPDINLEDIAKGTPGFSGAELAALVNEAAILAAMKEHAFVRQEDLEESRDKVRFGREKKSRAMDASDKRITAYHEAGHAVVNCELEHTEPVHKVTIIPRGMALGATMMLPEKDRMHLSYKAILDELAVLFGGRVAEEVFCDDITTGASNDIMRATQMARLMITEWGMSQVLGPIHLANSGGNEFLGSEFSMGKDHSEETARAIDNEVRDILAKAHQRARDLISQHSDALIRVAEGLLIHESITGDEMRALAAGTEPADLRPQSTLAPPPLPGASAGTAEDPPLPTPQAPHEEIAE
ncbi:MAG: ATP-dependent zinc metalloprotease FtsH [Planctomycetota bacterium]|nr:ATP-dependent zinc metalloprotease FtsH [Planctomycetota bacterium]